MLGDSGPVILMSHGSPGGYDIVEPVPGEFRTLAPSRPGYLRTPLELGLTPEEQAHVFAALLDHLAIDEVIVFVVSAGGPAGLSFAALYPERTLAVVAAEAVSGPIALPFLMPVVTGDFPVWVLGHIGWRLMGRRGLVRVMIPDAANRARLAEEPAGEEELVVLMGHAWPLTPRFPGTNNDSSQFVGVELPLAQITAPTLVVHGTADTNVPFEHGERTSAAIMNSQLHVIEGGDHLMPFTHKREFDTVVGDFLEGICSPQTTVNSGRVES